MVRALASHQCGPGSIPGPGVICGLSLCWFSTLLRGSNVARVQFPDPASYVGWVCVGSRPFSVGFSLSALGCVLGCAPRSCMDRTAAARRRLCMFSVLPCRAASLLSIVIVIETLLIENIRFSRKMPMMPQGNYLGHRWGKTASPKTVIVHTLHCRSSPWMRGAKLAPKWYYILLTETDPF